MKIRIRELEGGIQIVDFRGKLTLDQGSLGLRQAVVNLLNQRGTKIILNFGQVNHMDGGALGELVSCWKEAQSVGAKIKLLNLSSGLKQVMEITKLSTLFGEDYSDQQKAIISFREQPETELLNLAPIAAAPCSPLSCRGDE